MMEKLKLSAIFLLTIVGCVAFSNNLKELDLKVFKITIPKNWQYKKQQGIDSFVGEIKTKNSTLSFDYSDHGYANSLILTEEDFLKKELLGLPCYFCKLGVTYTAKWDVQKVKTMQMKEKGVTDSSLIKVEAFIEPQERIHKPTASQKKRFPEADYIAELTYKESTITVPIKVPKEITAHHISVDSTDKYIIKTVYPKVVSKGITGIYFKGKGTSFTFNLVGNNLSKQEQEAALSAFKTIKFK